MKTADQMFGDLGYELVKSDKYETVYAERNMNAGVRCEIRINRKTCQKLRIGRRGGLSLEILMHEEVLACAQFIKEIVEDE